MIGGQAVPVDPRLLVQGQAMGPGGVPMAAPGQPAQMPNYTSTTTTSGSSGGSAMPETAKVKDAATAQDAAAAMAIEAKKRETSLKMAEQAFRAEQTDRENELLKQKIEEQAALRVNEDAKVAKALQELEARQAEQAKLKPTTYIEDMGTMRRAIMAVGLALGAYGSSQTGGPNTAFQIFQAGENAHREKQRAEIEKAAQQIEMAGGNVKMANEMRAKALASIDEKYLLRNQFLQKQIEAKIQKNPKIAADGQMEVAKLEAERAKVKMETAQKLAGTKTWEGPKVSTTVVEGKPEDQRNAPGGIVTEAEAKKAQYASEILDSVATIKKSRSLTDKELRILNGNIQKTRAQVEQATKGVAKPLWNETLQKAGIMPESFYTGLSDDAKVAARAWLVGSGLIIRDQSGAAITNAEDFTNAQNRMIQPGEGPKVRNEKLRTMELTGKNMEKLAGRNAYYRLHGRFPEDGQGPPAPAQPGQAAPAAATPSQPSAQPTPAAAPKRDFSTARKSLTGMSKEDISWVKKAKAMKPGDPGYDKAQSWLKSKGL